MNTVLDLPTPRIRKLGVYRMDPTVKRMWVDALRSGLYKKTVDALRVDDAYCPLGVLCDVYVKATGKGEWVLYPEGGSAAFVLNGTVECGEPPAEVVRWAGLVDDDGFIDYNPLVAGKAVSVWNDSHDTTFEEMAEKISRDL